MKHLVVVADPICDEATARLAQHFSVTTLTADQRLRDHLHDASAIIVRSATQVTEDDIRAAPRLCIIARAGVGLDNIDQAAAKRAGIMVSNTPDANSVSAAEHTLALILAIARHIPQANATLRRKQWNRGDFVGVELAGKTLVVIGLGRIGQLVAERAHAFGMNITSYDPAVATVPSWINRAPQLFDAISTADFVTVHTPLNPSTKSIIGETELRTMRRGVRLVNTARGGIIDESALLDALNTGHVASAGIDVFKDEPPTNYDLVAHPNVVATPHLGASTTDAQNRAGHQVVDLIIAALD